MILLIDNYDSFTYNLVQRLGEIDPSLVVEVHRNDQITLDEIAKMAPDAVRLETPAAIVGVRGTTVVIRASQE